MAKVQILQGVSRGQQITGTYDLIRGFSEGSGKGSFITVQLHNGQKSRVYCGRTDFTIVSGHAEQVNSAIASNRQVEQPAAQTDYEAIVRQNETPEQAEARINQSFEVVEKMTLGAVKGFVRGLIISGPAGIGKSFSVEQTLADNLDEDHFEVVKGASTPIALYQILYRNRNRGQVLVFDDCDNILFDDVSLNLLKAVLDTSEKRYVSWNSSSQILEMNDVPSKFEFKGSVIFLTNLNFDKTTAKRLQPHLEALKSRCYYIDLGVSNKSDMMIRISSIVRRGMLNDYCLGENGEAEVMDFISSNIDGLRELSLRTVVKVAGLRATTPNEWREMAISTVLRPEAKWRSLLNSF